MSRHAPRTRGAPGLGEVKDGGEQHGAMSRCLTHGGDINIGAGTISVSPKAPRYSVARSTFRSAVTSSWGTIGCRGRFGSVKKKARPPNPVLTRRFHARHPIWPVVLWIRGPRRCFMGKDKNPNIKCYLPVPRN